MVAINMESAILTIKILPHNVVYYKVTKAVFDSIVELKPGCNIKEYDAAGLHDI